MENPRKAILKAAKGLGNSVPLILGVILLVSLMNALVPVSFYKKAFTGDVVTDSILGSTLGSVLAGNPVTSYIIGGEFLSEGVSLLAVTAFLVAWVTVGLVQMPAESMMLGKRFAIIRNISSFIFSMIIALITVWVVSLI